MLGGGRSTAAFIKKIEKTISKENSWPARNERFKNDPSYAMQHLDFLNDCRMSKESEEALNVVFTRRKIEENFNESSIAYYYRNVKDLKSPIIQYMLNNKKEVIALMGKDKYNQFINIKANDYIAERTFVRGAISVDGLNKSLDVIAENKMFKTLYYKFMVDAKDLFANKDFATIVKKADKYKKKATTSDRKRLIQTVTTAGSELNNIIIEENRAEIVAFIESANLYEKDKAAKEFNIKRVAFLKKSSKYKK